jgi:hypothetical protein
MWTRLFIGDYSLQCKGCHFDPAQKILMMRVRGMGIKDIATIEKISIKKILSVLTAAPDI